MLKPKPDQIAAWIEQNFDYKTRVGKNGKEYVIQSPFRVDDKFKFNINLEKATCHDWRGDEWAIGGSKSFIRFVQLYRNCSYTEAAKEIFGSGATLDAIYNRMKRNKMQEQVAQAEIHKYDVELPEGSMPLTGDKTKAARILIKWLESRGINADMIKQYKLHSCGADIIWPYYEYESLVYWQSRNRLNKTFNFPKTGSGGVGKGDYLYGFDDVEPSDYLGITEAIIDAMNLGNQIVASGGAALTPIQIKKIRVLNPVNGVVLAPDNDKAGLESLAANYEMIAPFFKVFYSVPPKVEMPTKKDEDQKYTKDWNDLYKVTKSNDEVRKIFENRIKRLTKIEMVQILRQIR